MESDHKFSKKFLLTLFIVSSLLSVDYFFRFSDSYIAEKKIEQIGKIQDIVKQDSLGIEPKRELLKLQTQVIKRQGFWELLSDLISFIHSTISSPKATKTSPIKAKPIIKKDSIVSKDLPPIQVMGSQSFESEKYKRSVPWHVITSCWVMILMMLIMPALSLKKDESKVSLGSLLAGEFILIVFCVFYSYILALIPIYENSMWNYVINFISFPIIIFLIALFKK